MKTILFLNVLLSGLVAGLFYAYSCSVNPGLRALPDIEYLKSMQSINTAIQNPVFFAAFMGLLATLPVSAFQYYRQNPDGYVLLVVSMAIYFIGVFGITAIGNVPLNDQLAAFNIEKSTPAEIAAMRNAFERPWIALHTVRTIASIASFGLLAWFAMKQKS